MERKMTMRIESWLSGSFSVRMFLYSFCHYILGQWLGNFFQPPWREERMIHWALSEGILAQSFWWPHPNPAMSGPIKSDNQEYVLCNIASNLWALPHLLFTTCVSVVIIPLWLMRTLRPKEAIWCPRLHTEGCSGNWKPGDGAPSFIQTLLSRPQPEQPKLYFIHVYEKQSQLPPNTQFECHKNH